MMRYKTYINKILFLGLVISFVTIQPAYDKWEGLTWSNIEYGLNYISKIPEKLDKKIKEADKALIKRYEESKIDKYMQDFAHFMAPVGNIAPELQSKLPDISRTTIKAVGEKITKKLLNWTDPVANVSSFAGAVYGKDKVGATKAAYSAALSGQFVTMCGALGACIGGPPGAVVGVVLGGIAYSEVIDPTLEDVADDTSNFLQDAQEVENNKTRRKRSNDVKRDKDLNIIKCSSRQEAYINGGERPHQSLYNMCIKYGIDIHDLCKYDSNKRKPGHCGCNKLETIDSDKDGVYDCNDECKDNSKLTKKGDYGKDGCQTKDDWRMEQIEAAGLKCAKYQFIQWNEEKNIPECVCQGGMVESKSGEECIDERLADEEPVKSCWEIENTRTITKDERHYCVCNRPFVWANEKEQKCVTCSERYPGSIPANTEKGCGCPEKTRWIKDLNKCANQKELAEYCDKKLPGSVAGKKGCVCPEGTEFDKRLFKCTIKVNQSNSEPMVQVHGNTCPDNNPGKKLKNKFDTNSNHLDNTYIICNYDKNRMLKVQIPFRNGKKHGIQKWAKKYGEFRKYTYINGIIQRSMVVADKYVKHIRVFKNGKKDYTYWISRKSGKKMGCKIYINGKAKKINCKYSKN